VKSLPFLCVVVGGLLAIVALVTVYLGALAALIVLPIIVALAFGAVYASDIPSHGREHARQAEWRADIMRRVNRRNEAAKELERGVAILREFIDDDSADDEIARLEAQAFWDRKRGKGR
jgi:hypothetical protein